MIFLLLPIVTMIVLFCCTTFYIVLQNRWKWQELKQNMAHRKFEIVIARYNEDLSWLCDPLILTLLKENEHRTVITIYNKGPNRSHLSMVRKSGLGNVREHRLENVGRDMHTYVYHMNRRYNDLADVTMFLPGSCKMLHKYMMMLNTINMAYKTGNGAFVCGDVRNTSHLIRDFEVKEYDSTSRENRSANSNRKLTPARLRPFGKWYDAVVGDVPLNYTTQFGIMAASKGHIHNRPQHFYESLEKELAVPDPELGFYVEISWISIFDPVNKECINATVLLSMLNTTINTLKLKSK